MSNIKIKLTSVRTGAEDVILRMAYIQTVIDIAESSYDLMSIENALRSASSDIDNLRYSNEVI